MLDIHDNELQANTFPLRTSPPAQAPACAAQDRNRNSSQLRSCAPGSSRSGARRAYVRLGDLDPEIADAVDAHSEQARSALVAYTYLLSPGGVNLDALGLPETTFAMIVLRGSLLHQTQAATGKSITFVSPGDVLMPFSARAGGLDEGVSLTANERVSLAALDQRFICAAARWPQLMLIIQRRLFDQQHRMAVHGAIGQLPRVDQRLLALIRHLADRAGRVTPEGTVLNHRLNHQELADLVGARRPTVSLALKRLHDRNELQRRDDGSWLLPHVAETH